MLRIIITKIKKFLEKMAKISNYSKDTSISGQDKVIGSDANSKFATKNYTIDDIADYAINKIDQVTPGNSITGRVSWSGEGLVFQSTLITGSLNGVTINIPQNLNIVLDPADPTNDRFDLFVVNTDNTLTVLEGTPSANPVKPSIDQLTQFEIGFVRVSAGQATPSELSNVTVYNEDLGQPTEWNFTTSLPAQIDPASTANPQSGEKSIYFKNLPIEGSVTFEAASAINASDIQSVTFKIKKNSLSAGVRISFYLGDNTDNVGDAALIFDGQFGFDGSNTSSYQNIVIDREDLNLPTVADITRMGFLVAPGFDGYIDNIKVNQSTNIEIPQTPLEWATYTGTRAADSLYLKIGDFDDLFPKGSFIQQATKIELDQGLGNIKILASDTITLGKEGTSIAKPIVPGQITLNVDQNEGIYIYDLFQEEKTFEAKNDVGFKFHKQVEIDGDFKLSNYGSGTNTGTATYSLNVDANGNVIEGPVGDTSNPTLQDVTDNGNVTSNNIKTTGDLLVGNNLVFQQSGNEKTINPGTWSTNYNFTLPNASGTIALTSDISTINLQNALDNGDSWTDGDQTYDFDISSGSGILSYRNTDEDWGWNISAEEQALFFTNGAGLSSGRSGIFGNSILIGNNNYVGSLQSTNLTQSRTFQLPDASGTIALTSDLSSLSADQETANFNATIDQVGVMVDVNSATDVVVTVRDFSIEPIPVGSILTYRQAGVGKISNTYLGAAGYSATTYRIGDVLTLWQKTQDNWVVINPPHAIDSQTVGEPTGSDQVLNVVSLTQAEYDAAVGSHNADTLYVITS